MGTSANTETLGPLAPARRDLTKARLNALAFADTERRLRRSGGRRGSFLTGAGSSSQGRPTGGVGGNTLLGQ